MIDISVIIKLGIIGLVPITLSVFFTLLERRTSFGKLKCIYRHIIEGVVFGAAAVFGTEYGVSMNGAIINVRDAAVLCGGLLFGGPVGIIAGLIGGIERWFAVYWGAGAFTRVACSVSTIAAGFYAAAINRFMMERRKPSPAIALVMGMVIEVFHMTMVFLTHIGVDINTTFAVVKSCTIPMVTINALSVFFATLIVRRFSDDKEEIKKETAGITFKIQKGLFIAILIAYAITTGFTLALQEGITSNDINSQLRTNLNDVQNEISDQSDSVIMDNLRNIAKEASMDMNLSDVMRIVIRYDLSEVNLVNRDGIIVLSSNHAYNGYDMNASQQSRAFMPVAYGNQKELVQPYQPIGYDSEISMKYAGISIDGGLLQTGYDEKRIAKIVGERIANITANRHIGDRGFIVITDPNDVIVSDSDKVYRDKKLQDVTGKTTAEYKQGQFEYKKFETNVFGEDVYAMYTVREGYSIFACIPFSQADFMKELELYVNSFMEILVFAALYAVIFFIIKKYVLKSITKVNCSLSRITAGDLDVKVEVRSTTEFDELSTDINGMVCRLKELIEAAKEKIKADLQLATNIQKASLPNTFPPYPDRKEIDLFASMNPAKEVGGDFYDYYWLDDKRIVLLIADVSGKGIPASLFMMKAKTMIKNYMESGLPVEEALSRANDGMCEGNDAEMFVTVWLGVVDVTTGHVEYANAGHNPPLIMHKGEDFRFLQGRAGFVLAGMEGVRFKKQEFDMEPGSTLLLYTDGVPEATTNNELYGEERMINLVNRFKNVNMEELNNALFSDVKAFDMEDSQFDDITIVSFHLNDGTEGEIKAGNDNEMTVDAITDNVTTVTEWVDKKLEAHDCPMKIQMQIDVAIDEIFSNIVNYAYNPEIGKATVRVEFDEEDMSVLLTFLDNGVPYDPLKKEDPDVTLKAEEREIGGLGIFIVKKTMDDVQYDYKNGQNILKIKKKL